MPNLPALTILTNKGQGAYLGFLNPLYITFNIERQTSKPIKSASCKGPIGCAIPNFITVSISSTPATPLYNVSIASLSIGIKIRLATKPG